MTANKLESASPAKPDFARSFRELRLAQKAKKGVPLYTLYVNRPAGRVIAAALRNTPFRPNHVTFAGAVLTYGALLWLAFGAGSGPEFALVGVALAGGFILDSADGQLARLQGRSSKLGEWLDHVLDSGRIVLLHGAVFCFLLRATQIPPTALAVLCGSFLFANSAIFFAGALFDQLNRQSAPPRPGGRQDSRNNTLLRSVLTLPVDYGTTCLVMLTVPWTAIFLPSYAALALCHCLFAAAYLAKFYRTLARMG
jgi:phosphatidylglycerophosphate synthase